MIGLMLAVLEHRVQRSQQHGGPLGNESPHGLAE